MNKNKFFVTNPTKNGIIAEHRWINVHISKTNREMKNIYSSFST